MNNIPLNKLIIHNIINNDLLNEDEKNEHLTNIINDIDLNKYSTMEIVPSLLMVLINSEYALNDEVLKATLTKVKELDLFKFIYSSANIEKIFKSKNDFSNDYYRTFIREFITEPVLKKINDSDDISNEDSVSKNIVQMFLKNSNQHAIMIMVDELNNLSHYLTNKKFTDILKLEISKYLHLKLDILKLEISKYLHLKLDKENPQILNILLKTNFKTSNDMIDINSKNLPKIFNLKLKAANFFNLNIDEQKEYLKRHKEYDVYEIIDELKNMYNTFLLENSANRDSIIHSSESLLEIERKIKLIENEIILNGKKPKSNNRNLVL